MHTTNAYFNFCRHIGLCIQRTRIPSTFQIRKSLIPQDLKERGLHHTLLYLLGEDLICAMGKSMLD